MSLDPIWSVQDEIIDCGRYNPFLVLGIINARSAAPYVRIAITEPEFGIMDVPIHILNNLTSIARGCITYSLATPCGNLNFYSENGWSSPTALYILRNRNGDFFTTDIYGNWQVWDYAELKCLVQNNKIAIPFLNILPKYVLENCANPPELSSCLEWSSKEYLVLGNINHCPIAGNYWDKVQEYIKAASLRCKMSGLDCNIRFGGFVGGFTFSLNSYNSTEPFYIPPQANFLDRVSFAHACPTQIICHNPYFMLAPELFFSYYVDLFFLSSVIWAHPDSLNSASIRKLFLRIGDLNFGDGCWWGSSIHNAHIEYASEYASLCTSEKYRNAFLLHKQIADDGILAIADFPNLDVRMSDYYATASPFPAYIPNGIKGLSKSPARKRKLVYQDFVHDVHDYLKPEELYQNTQVTSKFPRIAP